MRRKSIYREIRGRSPKVRIRDYLLEKRPFETTKEEIIKETKTSRNSFFKEWKRLEDFRIVKDLLQLEHTLILSQLHGQSQTGRDSPTKRISGHTRLIEA
jgi:hypothetical protein